VCGDDLIAETSATTPVGTWLLAGDSAQRPITAALTGLAARSAFEELALRRVADVGEFLDWTNTCRQWR
jgi:hypothetical protein